MATSKLSNKLDEIMEHMTSLARAETDKELKLAMVDRLLKYEALKLKAQQGSMGSGFDDPEAA